MFIGELFIIAKIQKQHKCPVTDEQIKKDVFYIHEMEYYSAIKKKNEVLPLAMTWMDMDNFMLSEISQTEKDKYCMKPLIYGI